MHEDAKKVQAIMEKEYPFTLLAKRLQGRKGGLRPSKPGKDGLLQYIWRMCRFHSGHDVSMPVMATFDLSNWLKNNNIKPVYGILGDREKEIINVVEAPIDLILTTLGEDPNAGARRWGRALGHL